MFQNYSFKAFHDNGFIIATLCFLGTGIIFEVSQMLGIEEFDKDIMNIWE